MNSLTERQLKQACAGRWDIIIPHLAPDLAKAVKAAPGHVPCPVHSGKDGLRAFDDFNNTGGMVCNTCGFFPNGFLVLRWVNDWTFQEAVNAVQGRLNELAEVGDLPAVDFDDPTPDVEDEERRRRALEEVIGGSCSLADSKAEPARRYLRNRGLSPDFHSEALRYHPCLAYCENGVESQFPALLGFVSKDDGIASIHRTYITHNGGKAPVASPKKLMRAVWDGATKGAAVRLIEPSERLSVAEGIETALAVHEATEFPVWATVSATGMKSVQIPDYVQTVDIWADKDLSGTGQKAAEVLAERLYREGKNVYLRIPPLPIPPGSKGVDWLDVLNAEDTP